MDAYCFWSWPFSIISSMHHIRIRSRNHSCFSLSTRVFESLVVLLPGTCCRSSVSMTACAICLATLLGPKLHVAENHLPWSWHTLLGYRSQTTLSMRFSFTPNSSTYVPSTYGPFTNSSSTNISFTHSHTHALTLHESAHAHLFHKPCL